jgi:ubiquinone/menaquinone biosynthesis C-methylase UbiE
MKQLLRSMGQLSGKSILDVGCGQGLFSIYFPSNGAKVFAVDLSVESVKLAIHYARSVSQNVRAAVATAEDLPFSDASFDIVFAAATLHHVDIEATAAEIFRVLKPGGKLFAYEPLAYNPFLKLYRFLTPRRRTPTERPLRYQDLKPFWERFVGVEYGHYHLFGLLPQAVGAVVGKRLYRRIQWLDEYLDVIDRISFKLFPYLRRYAQVLTICAQKPRSCATVPC